MSPIASSGPARTPNQVDSTKTGASDQSRGRAAGTAAAERAKNADRGIPASRLGPSGKPKIHNVEHSTKKAAMEAAKREGKGTPMKHSKTDKQPSHFHSTDQGGKKIPGTHHNYRE